MIQKHPKLMTYYAQAYRIKCLYNTGERPINVGFNVSMLTTAGTIANTGPPPTCTMRICNANGADISQVRILGTVKHDLFIRLTTVTTVTVASEICDKMK